MPIGVVMVGMAVIVWWPAFTLGAWHEVFFDDILAVWAASTAGFVFVLVEHRRVGQKLLRAFVLLVPSFWLLLNFIVDDQSTDLAAGLLALMGIFVVLVGLPFTLWVLVQITWPDLGGETPRRAKVSIAFVVVAVVGGSFLLGVNQSRFLTCEDFAISGNSEPPGCTPAGA